MSSAKCKIIIYERTEVSTARAATANNAMRTIAFCMLFQFKINWATSTWFQKVPNVQPNVPNGISDGLKKIGQKCGQLCRFAAFYGTT